MPFRQGVPTVSGGFRDWGSSIRITPSGTWVRVLEDCQATSLTTQPPRLVLSDDTIMILLWYKFSLKTNFWSGPFKTTKNNLKNNKKIHHVNQRMLQLINRTFQIGYPTVSSQLKVIITLIWSSLLNLTWTLWGCNSLLMQQCFSSPGQVEFCHILIPLGGHSFNPHLMDTGPHSFILPAPKAWPVLLH